MKISTKAFHGFAAAVCMLLLLPGCVGVPYDGKPHMDAGLQDLTNNTVTRMTVMWTEREDHAYTVASYNVAANYFHWSENDNQYRWILVRAAMRRDKFGSVLRDARIPDNVPMLHKGDIVDVYLPVAMEMNYDQLKSAIILRLVCEAADKPCQEKSKEQVGKLGMEVISKGMPDMSGLTFTKKYDKTGKRLIAGQPDAVDSQGNPI